jgi:SAM-dependent methyltransferase
MINRLRVFFPNIFFHILGLVFLLLAKIKYYVFGYPVFNATNIAEYEKRYDYIIRVVDQWVIHLNNYTGKSDQLNEKIVLELGPGSDLGVGFYLLYKGILRYNSCDIYNLVKNVPDDFYKSFFKRLQKKDGIKTVSYLEKELDKINNNLPCDINHVVNADFNLTSAFDSETIDIVFSQAAFEHFQNVEATIKQLSIVCKPNAIIVAEIDLQAHTRWIREKDPNNIYRYSNFIYKLLSVKATPNRIRPYTYYELFKKYGWYDIKIIPLSTIDKKNIPPDRWLNKNFRENKNDMNYLSIVLMAKKSDATNN